MPPETDVVGTNACTASVVPSTRYPVALPLEFNVNLLKIMSLSGAIMSTSTTCFPARLLGPLTVTLMRSPGLAVVDDTPRFRPFTEPVGVGLAVVGLAVAVDVGELVVECDELELLLALALEEPVADGEELGLELVELHAPTASVSGTATINAVVLGVSNDMLTSG